MTDWNKILKSPEYGPREPYVSVVARVRKVEAPLCNLCQVRGQWQNPKNTGGVRSTYVGR